MALSEAPALFSGGVLSEDTILGQNLPKCQIGAQIWLKMAPASMLSCKCWLCYVGFRAIFGDVGEFGPQNDNIG